MKRFLNAFVGVIFAVCAVSFFSSVTVAAQTGGIGGRPAEPDTKNPRTQSIFIHTAERSSVVTDSIIVSNNSDSKRTIELYAVDGVVTNTGAYTCRQKAEELQDSGKWISLEKTSVTLERAQKETVKFTIAVPSNADVGEHNACIVLADADQKPSEEGGITVRTRQAVRVVTTIPGDLKRDITIAGFSTEITGGKGIYTTTLQNTGNVSADVEIGVVMRSLFGATVYKNDGQYPVISDQKLDVRYEDDKLPMWGGWYDIQSSIKYDKEPGSFGIADDADLVQKKTDQQRVFVTPSAVALVIYSVAMLAIAGLVYYTLRKRSHKLSVKRDWQNYTVKPGDTIESIAIKHAVDWKKLAKANRLKAPYGVTEGQKIKAPRRK